MAETLLSLQNVGKHFQMRTVLRSVSVDIFSDSLTLMVGANGAGKSTLLRMMAGLTEPDSGERTCFCDVADMAYLGHATFMYNNLTAFENLHFWESVMGETPAEDVLLHMLERVELGKFAHEFVGGFSRGMVQRLNLARVLLRQPKLLLLDEPSTGLDTRSRTMLWQEMQQLRKSGSAVVCITHDPHVFYVDVDRVLALGGRRVMFDGSSDQYEAFLHDTTHTARQEKTAETTC